LQTVDKTALLSRSFDEMVDLLGRSLEEGSFPDYGARRWKEFGVLGDLPKDAADLRKRQEDRGRHSVVQALPRFSALLLLADSRCARRVSHAR
jgi:hypothetical protein